MSDPVSWGKNKMSSAENFTQSAIIISVKYHEFVICSFCDDHSKD